MLQVLNKCMILCFCFPSRLPGIKPGGYVEARWLFMQSAGHEGLLCVVALRGTPDIE